MAHLRLCFLVFCLRYAESQDLKILDAEPIKVLMNENVTLPCKFGAQVWDLRIIGITWYYRLKEVEKTIYQFDGNRGVHVAKRSGSTMLIEEIKKGNGALHLPRIQINEEGEYKCVVFVTPSKAEGIFRLQVSAQPISSLLPKEVEVQIGTEKSVSCRMEGFYPQAFEISWWTSKYGVISEDTCTGYPEKNQDGTYNVTSYLRLQPSIEDNKNIYTCIVQHRSLSVPLMLNTTLTVKEKDSFLSVFIEAVVGNTLAWIVFVVCFLCIHKRHPKIVAPKVTDIIGNKVLVHNEEATLSCNVTGFWPEEITVIFSLVQPEKTSTVFYCWPIQRPANENDMQANVPLWNNMEITINRTQMFSQAPIKSHCDGTYSLSCKIIIVPDAEQHNGAEFCLTVKHKALEEPVHQKRLLSVIGRVPTVSEIMKPPRIIHQERIMLTCPINGFKQRPSKLTWIKKQQNEEKKLVVYDSGRDEVDYFSENYSHMISEHTFGDGTLSILSALSFTPSVTADNDAMFLCRIRNNATEEDVVKTLTLCVKATLILLYIYYIYIFF
ncbi:hypothetical protein NDU88_002368 [Pleurodeles waltl]|uniref:Ig-like domain-containing protein n=1 Tax=Pleurodeles waltl TaxID=8319 RepID=A0AAV7TKX4_PLEWA|nr:hypothetical protein NDU88_002368 [Pleurodeles waltl]